MPYISLEYRPKYADVIQETVSTIVNANVQRTTKAEYFGYFVHMLVNRYVQFVEITQPMNSYQFPAPVRTKLQELGTKAATLIGSGEPMEVSGHLNYVVTSVLWGLLAIPEMSSYGVRAFLSGSIYNILQDMTKMSLPIDTKDRIMAYRRYVSVQGVLNDVLNETYRRRTSVYEDKKILENGDI